MLISVTQVRTGMILQIDGALFRVMKTHHVAPGNVRGAMQTTMRNLASGSKVGKRLRSTDRVERVTVESQEMEYLYADGDEYVFTVDTFEATVIGDPADNGEFDSQHHRTRPAGATASASMKPATLETGLVVQVPQFVKDLRGHQTAGSSCGLILKFFVEMTKGSSQA